jgi:hypothetical protein
MEARARHIAGKDIVIATGNEDGSITTYWDKVYKPESLQSTMKMAA